MYQGQIKVNCLVLAGREDPRQYIDLEQRHQIRMKSVCGEGGASGAAGGAT